MTVDASTIAPNIDGVAMAITDANADLIATVDEVITSIGDAMEACCAEWAAQGMGAITVPGCPACVDGMGNVITPATPPQTITATTWGEVQLGQTLMTINAQQSIAGTYAASYAAYLQELEDYRNQLLFPQVVALLAQLAVFLEMYECWRDMLKNQVKPTVTDVLSTFHPKLVADFCDNVDGQLSEKMSVVAEGFADKYTSVDESCNWIETVRDDLWMCYREDGITADGAGYAVMEKLHVQNMAQHLATICMVGANCAEDTKERIGNLYDTNQLTFTAFEKRNIELIEAELNDLYSKAGGICAYMNQCGQTLVECYTTDLLPDIKEFLTPQLENAVDCLDTINAAINEAKACQDTMKDLYDKYLAQEELIGPAILEQANTLAECGDLYKELWTNFTTCADDWKTKYGIDYEGNESLLTEKIFALACDMATDEYTYSYEFARDLADECLAHWQDSYKACDTELSAIIFEEAKALYATRKDSFDALCEMSEKYYDHWCSVYQPLEVEYVTTLMDKVTKLICTYDEELADFCVDAQNHLDWWKSCYQDPECAVAPYIIEAGTKAVDQKADTYMTLDMFMDHLLEKWEAEFCPCDIEDLNKACDVYSKVDPWCEIVENNECAQQLGERLKSCAEEFESWEKEYLRELCSEDPYEPDYCPVEDRAVLHVRAKLGKLSENIVRCAPRYNPDGVTHDLEQTAIEQAKGEAAVMQSAHRFERWWAEQQNQRRHGRKLSAFEIVRGYRIESLGAYQQSTTGNDQLLSRIHDRIVRGYNYLNIGNQMGGTSTTGTAQAIDEALTSINNGHFYPQLYANMKSQYQNKAESLVRIGQQQLEQGHFHQQIALNAKQAADQVANQAGQQGLQAMQHGQRFKDQALNANIQAERTVKDGIDWGFSMIDRGHFWVDQSHQWSRSGLQTTDNAFSQANAAIGRGHDAMRLALAFEQQRDQMATICRNNGQEAAAYGLEVLRTGHQKVRDSMQASMQAIQDSQRFMAMGIDRDAQWMSGGINLTQQTPANVNAFGGLVGQGHDLARMGLGMAQQKASMSQQGVQMACEALYKWHHCAIDGVYGVNGTLGIASGLANNLGGGVGQALEGALGSLTGIFSGPPSFNAPPSLNDGGFGDFNIGTSSTSVPIGGSSQSFGSFGNIGVGNGGFGSYGPSGSTGPQGFGF